MRTISRRTIAVAISCSVAALSLVAAHARSHKQALIVDNSFSGKVQLCIDDPATQSGSFGGAIKFNTCDRNGKYDATLIVPPGWSVQCLSMDGISGRIEPNWTVYCLKQAESHIKFLESQGNWPYDQIHVHNKAGDNVLRIR